MSITLLVNDDSEKISCASVMDILFVLCLMQISVVKLITLAIGKKSFCYVCQFCLVSTKIEWSNNYLFNSADPHSKCLFAVVHRKKNVFHPFLVFRRSVAENSFFLGYDADSLGNRISTFREKVVPLTSSVYMSHRENYSRSILLGNIDLRKTH
jgi:hypothetical protein